MCLESYIWGQWLDSIIHIEMPLHKVFDVSTAFSLLLVLLVQVLRWQLLVTDCYQSPWVQDAPSSCTQGCLCWGRCHGTTGTFNNFCCLFWRGNSGTSAGCWPSLQQVPFWSELELPWDCYSGLALWGEHRSERFLGTEHLSQIQLWSDLLLRVIHTECW